MEGWLPYRPQRSSCTNISLLVLLCLTCHVTLAKPVSQVFPVHPPGTLLHTAGRPLALEWRHVLTDEEIRWCYWEYKDTPAGNWSKILGFDNDHNTRLNISESHIRYTFLEGKSPCQNGIWSSSTTPPGRLLGHYNMVVVAKNTSKYQSAETVVSLEADTGVPPCVCPTAQTTENATCTTIIQEGRGGAVAVVVFFLLLLILLVVLIVLYIKRKLPESFLTKMKIPPPGGETKPRLDPESKGLLDQYQEADLKAVVRQLENQLRMKDEELEILQTEMQTRINNLVKEKTALKQEIETKEAEIAIIYDERQNMKNKFDEDQKEKADLLKKVEELERKRNSKLEGGTVPRSIANKIGTSFRKKPDERPIEGAVSSPGFILAFNNSYKLKPTEDLSLKVKLQKDFEPKFCRYSSSIDKSPDVTFGKGKHDKEKIKIKIPKTSRNLCGIYSCVATRGPESHSSQAVVQVVEGDQLSPVFMTWFKDTFAKGGEDVSFSVTVNGHPVPDPEWTVKGKPVAKDDRYKVVITDKKHQELTSTLTINPAAVRDTGEVTATATHHLGNTTCTAQLTVLDDRSAPDFTRGLKPRTAKTGDDVTFIVFVVGNPDPDIEWYKGGRMIALSDRVTVSESLEDGKIKSVLTIRKCTPADGGQLSVTAANEVSKTYCDAQFTVT